MDSSMWRIMSSLFTSSVGRVSSSSVRDSVVCQWQENLIWWPGHAPASTCSSAGPGELFETPAACHSTIQYSPGSLQPLQQVWRKFYNLIVKEGLKKWKFPESVFSTDLWWGASLQDSISGLEVLRASLVWATFSGGPMFLMEDDNWSMCFSWSYISCMVLDRWDLRLVWALMVSAILCCRALFVSVQLWIKLFN